MDLKDAARITRPLSHEDAMEIIGELEESRKMEVDYSFLAEAITEAYAPYADPIEKAYHDEDDAALGKAVRAQIEHYREFIRELHDD